MTFRLPSELVDAVDAARGDVSRTRFLERAVEKALGSAGSAALPSGTYQGSPGQSSAPSRPFRPIPVVDGRGRRMKVSIAPHHPKCACYECKPPKS